MADTNLYLQHSEVIERAIAFVCWRHRLSGPDSEDFASAVRVHLIEDDSAALRAFGGRCSIQTYLVTVVTHQFQDWRNAKWGKWRPSAEARRMGPLGVLLETRLVRDGFSMNEAVEMLRTNHGVTEPRPVLESMAARFPSRPGRTFVGEQVLEARPAAHSRADVGLSEDHARAAAQRAGAALEAATRDLASQDRLILRMRFDEGAAVAAIARLLHLEAKPLYRRIECLLRDLRAALEAAGVDASDAADVLEHRGFDLAHAGGSESSAQVRLFSRRADSPASTGRSS